jgi:hypothetical protein
MIQGALYFAFACVSISILLNVYRLLSGPGRGDRILALDTMVINSIALIILFGIERHYALFRGGAAPRDGRLRQHRRLLQVHPARRHRGMSQDGPHCRDHRHLAAGSRRRLRARRLVGPHPPAVADDAPARSHQGDDPGRRQLPHRLGGYLPWSTGTYTAHEFLITLFLFITAPVSANMIAKAHIHRQGWRLDPNPADNVVEGLPPTGGATGWATFWCPPGSQWTGSSLAEGDCIEPPGGSGAGPADALERDSR